MSDEKRYQDSEGRMCSLDTMCRREPGWAANRLRASEAEVARLTAELAGVRQNAENTAGIFGLKCSENARMAAQLKACAEALEQAANGEEVRCLVSEQPGVYECRLDSLCAGCRARGRIAKLEAANTKLVELCEEYEAQWGDDYLASKWGLKEELAEAKAELERVKGG